MQIKPIKEKYYIFVHTMEDFLHQILSNAQIKSLDTNNPFFHILRHFDEALQDELEKEKHTPSTPSSTNQAKPSMNQTKSIPTDIYRDGDIVHVYMDIPGVVKSDITIDISGTNMLSISVEKKVPKHNNEECLLKERAFGYLRKTVQLPKHVDRSTVQAKYDAGVLHITCVYKNDAESKQRIIVQ